MTTENNVAAQASDEPMPCPECSNEYLAIRNDIHKDGRAFVYCDVCGCMAPKSVWNRITPRATADVERDKGLEAAAALIDRKVNAYDDDMGSTDQETGTREYPGDGGEWVNEMGELAEEIRALKSVATTKPGA